MKKTIKLLIVCLFVQLNYGQSITTDSFTHDWDYYYREVDEKMSLIYFNKSFLGNYPVKGLEEVCEISWSIKNPMPNGLPDEEEKKKIVANLNEPLLAGQPKQLEAVAKSLLAKDLALIQGPPGTGKTTVIAEIIWQTLLREPEAKILITSQTNLAVDNALERLKGKKLVRPIRVGNIDKFEDEGKV